MCVARLAAVFIRFSHSMARPCMYIIIDSDNETIASEQDRRAARPLAELSPPRATASRRLPRAPAQKPTQSKPSQNAIEPKRAHPQNNPKRSKTIKNEGHQKKSKTRAIKNIKNNQKSAFSTQLLPWQGDSESADMHEPLKFGPTSIAPRPIHWSTKLAHMQHVFSRAP